MPSHVRSKEGMVLDSSHYSDYDVLLVAISEKISTGHERLVE